jgi:hypothetical protein
LKKLGVEAKDIATDVYVIEPIYEDYDSLYIKGYRIHNMVAVTLRDVKKASAVIAAALKAGANQVVNVEFYTSELRKYRDQARDLAVKAAKEKAQALASAAGAETGCVLYINENTWSYYNGWWWWYGRNNQNLWTQNVVQNAAPSGTSGGTGNNSAGDECKLWVEMTGNECTAFSNSARVSWPALNLLILNPMPVHAFLTRFQIARPRKTRLRMSAPPKAIKIFAITGKPSETLKSIGTYSNSESSATPVA